MSLTITLLAIHGTNVFNINNGNTNSLYYLKRSVVVFLHYIDGFIGQIQTSPNIAVEHKKSGAAKIATPPSSSADKGITIL
jgi:hypothetical protein